MVKSKQIATKLYKASEQLSFIPLRLAYKSARIVTDQRPRKDQKVRNLAVKRTRVSRLGLRIEHIQTNFQTNRPNSQIVIVGETLMD